LKLFNPDTIVCEGSTHQYSAQGTNSNKWISKNSISCDTCPVVNITALQNDNLILYSKDANQCDFIGCEPTTENPAIVNHPEGEL
jgi:hypothetical protein